MIKGEILDNFLTKENILNFYNDFEPNYCGDLKNLNKEGKPHAFERLFGVFVNVLNKNIVTFNIKV